MLMSHSPYYKRTVVKDSLHSTHLQRSRALRVFLPPDYDEFLQYPVIYCQDGEQFFNFGRIATIVSRLIHEEGLEPVIVVGIDVELSRRNAEYDPQGEYFQAYCRFIAEELVPYIEANYAARSDVDERIVAGDSLGGTVSLHLALDYPELFQKMISLSGAFFDPTQQAIASAGNLSPLDIFMLIGLDETEVKTDRGVFDFVTANRSAKKLLEEKGARIKYIEKPGEHLWGFWQKELDAALKYFL